MRGAKIERLEQFPNQFRNHSILGAGGSFSGRPIPAVAEMKRWLPTIFFLQCALFALQLWIWIFFDTQISIVTLPVTFCFVCFSLWLWLRAEH